MSEVRFRTFVVHWEGPYKWARRDRYVCDEHVLYAIHGTHPVYGRDVLLYIGMGAGGVKSRLDCHDKDWVDDEYDPITVRLASAGPFAGWRDWEVGERYPRPASEDVRDLESLLILANQPAYNSAVKQGDLRSAGLTDLMIMNTGHFGQMLPEVSYLYHRETWQDNGV